MALDEDLTWQVADGDHAKVLKTSPGNIWINPPNTAFSHNISDPCYFVILAIEEQTFLSSCPLNIDVKSLTFLNNYNVVDTVIKGIIELFISEVQGGGRNGKSYLNNLLALLSNHYIQHYSNYLDLQNAQLAASKFDQSQIEKVDQYIDSHIDQAIAVDNLADLLHCSKFYFLREFKKLTSVTPYQYIIGKKLEQAKLALNTENANIAQIAHDFGFNDQSHFTRAFKGQFGLTPGQYLKNH